MRRRSMQPSTDRVRRIGRHAFLWLAGPIVLLVRDPLPELARPMHCAGALDLLSILIVRRWPDATMGQLLAWLEPVVVTIALACVGEWFSRLTRNPTIALGLAILAGCSPAFALMFAPPTAIAAVGICAAAAIAVYAGGANRRIAALALAVVWITSHAPLAFGSPWYSCVVPSIPSAAWLHDAATQFIFTTGPVVLCLAAVGGARGIRQRGARPMLAAFVLTVIASAPVTGVNQLLTLAPILVLIWSLAAVGLDEISSMMRQARGGAVSGAVLLCLLPVLELSRVRANERDNVVRPLSHERASLEAITSILNLVPNDARFVEEDATVSLLLRAAVLGGRRTTKPFAVIAPTRAAVEKAISVGPVYAFPHGQTLLGLRGFAIQRVDELNIRGIARVSATRPCRQLEKSWTDLSAEGASGRIAVAADSEDDVGPIVLYFGGSTEYAPGPDGWPPRTRSGFELALFNRTTAANSKQLDAESRDMAFHDRSVAAAPFVSRIFVRRTRRSPLQLPIVLGPPPSSGIGRLRDNASPADRIAVCDAPPVSVSMF